MRKSLTNNITFAIILLIHLQMYSSKPCFEYKNWDNPCFNITCPYNAECVPALNVHTYQCRCYTECYDVGDSENSGPVCGSDGRNYENECEMSKMSCLAVYPVTVKYRGLCNPCSEHVCAPTERCKIDSKRRPYCECEPCTMSSSGVNSGPICANDGKTYRNRCHMRYIACRQELDVQELHKGACTLSEYCSIRCPHPYMVCRIIDGISKCLCPDNCPEVMDTVCGDDGNVYQSLCHLKEAACLKLRMIQPVQKGDCGTSNLCKYDHWKCLHGSVCRVEAVEAQKNQFELKSKCVRPECLTLNLPGLPDAQVCGSDTVTYKSECHLRQQAFDTKSELKVLHKTRCDACQSVRCPYYSLCRVNTKGQAECVCPNHCVYNYSPVCGSDGVTYDMLCDMQSQACLKKKNIKVSSQGKCPLNSGVTSTRSTTAATVNSDKLLDDFWGTQP